MSSVTNADANKPTAERIPPTIPILRGLNKSIKILPKIIIMNKRPIDSDPTHAEI